MELLMRLKLEKNWNEKLQATCTDWLDSSNTDTNKLTISFIVIQLISMIINNLL